MDTNKIKQYINEFVEASGSNIIDPSVAMSSEAAGQKIYDDPLIGFASADNEYLNILKSIPEAKVKLDPPKFWLPEAKTVISFFLPYAEEIKKSNVGGAEPSILWLHGRIEGQALINELLNDLKDFLEEQGYDVVIPMFDERFWAKMGRDTREDEFGSNWSERHVAFAAGLGTFSLSKGLITEKGVAGRFGSLITTAEVEPITSKCKDIYENCIMCGKCGRNCPAGAISLENGKIHKPCSDYLDNILEVKRPYYGCGKCQVGVPCESSVPER